MNLFGLTIARTKALSGIPGSRGHGGWFGIVRESFSGAWQRNIEVSTDTVLTYSAVYACVTLIASDVAKLRLKLVEKDKNGIWLETESPAYSPVLRKPNRYQTRIKFFENWVTSKLIHGNTYALKQRDDRRVVTALYILDPTRVKPLVADDGSVFYELHQDNLTGLQEAMVTVPAAEIIHDTMVPLYHPLCGVSPIHACGLAATQGLRIQTNSANFFGNQARPSGILTAPAKISNETAKRLKAHWEENYTGGNIGKTAVLGDGLKYEQLSVNAIDAQLIEQLKWTAETVCSCFHVPPYMIGVGPAPTYNNIEALNQQYYAQCLQTLIESIEVLLDEGLELKKSPQGRQYGTEFDLDDLLRMDTATRVKAAAEAIGSGGMAPDEARKRYFDLGPVKGGGGESPYLQEQNWPLRLLAGRELPTRPPTAPAPIDEPTPAEEPAANDNEAMRALYHMRKGLG